MFYTSNTAEEGMKRDKTYKTFRIHKDAYMCAFFKKKQTIISNIDYFWTIRQ